MDQEKLNKGLECCIVCAKTHVCPAGCPYAMDEGVADGLTVHCDGMLLMDAQLRIRELEAAQAPQPARLLPLEEVKRLLPGADVWIEYHDLTGWKIAAITVREIFDNGLLGELQSLRYSFDRYGRYNGDWLAWRCWTSRPTDEQREAAAWTTD